MGLILPERISLDKRSQRRLVTSLMVLSPNLAISPTANSPGGIKGEI